MNNVLLLQIVGAILIALTIGGLSWLSFSYMNDDQEEDLPISPDWDMEDDDMDALDASGSF